MASLEERLEALEREVAELRAVQDIQQMRFAYWFALVDKDVPGLLDCFTEDIQINYGFGIELSGQNAVRQFFDGLLQAEDLISQIPRGANPQISLTSETEASGRWLAEVTTLRRSQEDGRRFSLQYFEKYRKTAAGWKICELRNDYLGFESFTRREAP